MDQSEIFTHAAENVHVSYDNHTGWHTVACQALYQAKDDMDDSAQERHNKFADSKLMFADLFLPDGVAIGDRWFGRNYQSAYSDDTLENAHERKEHRIFALLLMSEICKD